MEPTGLRKFRHITKRYRLRSCSLPREVTACHPSGFAVLPFALVAEEARYPIVIASKLDLVQGSGLVRGSIFDPQAFRVWMVSKPIRGITLTRPGLSGILRVPIERRCFAPLGRDPDSLGDLIETELVKPAKGNV